MLLALHNVVTGFLRRSWLVAIVTVIACAGLAARAVAALSDAALSDGETAGHRAGVAAATAAPAPPAPVMPRLDPPGGDAFVARNIFCSTCAPSRGGGGGGGSYQGHPAVLIATSIGAEPRATVRVVPTEAQGSWGLGEEIPGVGRLDEIHATSIEVADAAGNTRRISLHDAPGSSEGGGGPGSRTGEKPPGVENPYDGRIEKINEGTYEIERSLVRELVMNASRPGMGGATPVLVNGEVQGLKLLGISTRSPAYWLGLRTGDQVSSIDGEPLKNAQVLLDMFAKLDQVSAVELGGTRRAGKQPLKLTLKLR